VKRGIRGRWLGKGVKETSLKKRPTANDTQRMIIAFWYTFRWSKVFRNEYDGD